MVELNAFNYYPGKSFIHNLDVRFKLIILIIVSLSCLKADLIDCLAMTLLLTIQFYHIKIPLISITRELRYFLLILILVFIARVLATPGTVIFENVLFSITQEGLLDGTVVTWRLFLVILVSLIFVSTTPPSLIKAGVERLMAPIPILPSHRIAIMIGLIIRFIPVIVNQAGETLDAQRARGIENRKSPVYRMIRFAGPLFRRTFENADNLALAMEARCYSEKRTDPGLVSNLQDWIALSATTGICILILL